MVRAWLGQAACQHIGVPDRLDFLDPKVERQLIKLGKQPVQKTNQVALVNGHPADTWPAGRAIRPKMCYFVGGQGEDSSALILVRGMIGRVLDRFRRT